MAVVDFPSQEELNRAFELSGKLLKGNNVRITPLSATSSFSKKRNLHKPISQEDTTDCLLDSGRIFVKNLPQLCDENEIKELFEKYGAVVEIDMPLDKTLHKPIGIAFITFMLPENAVTAFNNLDNSIFKGKVLSLKPARIEEIHDDTQDENTGNYKLNKLKNLKKNASKMSHTWNTLFINQNAVANILSQRLGIEKEKLLTDSNSAVSLAAGETALVNETKHFLEENGVNLDSFRQVHNYYSSLNPFSQMGKKVTVFYSLKIFLKI